MELQMFKFPESVALLFLTLGSLWSPGLAAMPPEHVLAPQANEKKFTFSGKCQVRCQDNSCKVVCDAGAVYALDLPSAQLKAAAAFRAAAGREGVVVEGTLSVDVRLAFIAELASGSLDVATAAGAEALAAPTGDEQNAPKTEVAYGDVSIPRVNYSSGGDADIFTKKGRVTHYKVIVSELKLDTIRGLITGRVLYDVQEGRSDHTRLVGETTFEIPAPRGAKRLVARDKVVAGSLTGENHNWIAIALSPDQCFRTLELKVDGKGDDDQGNAALKGRLAIEVEL
jgi:hypothetical protein